MKVKDLATTREKGYPNTDRLDPKQRPLVIIAMILNKTFYKFIRIWLRLGHPESKKNIIFFF
jgi:hypothetical protein